MQLCLVRHAIAVERGTKGYLDDRARPLTPLGRKRMKETAQGLKTLVKPGIILTSPVLRAKQTSEILGDVLGVKVEKLEALGNGDHLETLAACEPRPEELVMLVGHEPWMSELLSFLLTGEDHAATSIFRKGAAALVMFPGLPRPGAAALEWLVQPAALRRLAKPHPSS